MIPVIAKMSENIIRRRTIHNMWSLILQEEAVKVKI